MFATRRVTAEIVSTIDVPPRDCQLRPAVVLTLSYFAPGDTNVFAGPAEQHNVVLAVEQGSTIPDVVKFFEKAEP